MEAENFESKRSLINEGGLGSQLPQTFGELSRTSFRIYRGGGIGAVCGLVAGVVHLIYNDNFEHLFQYFAIGFSCLFCLKIWMRGTLSGIPLLPIFIVQQSIIYALPFVIQDENFRNASETVRFSATVAICIFLLAITAGWSFGKITVTRSPLSKFVLFLANRKGDRVKIMRVGIMLLAFGFLFNVFSRSGVLYRWLPNEFVGLIAIVRAVVDAAVLIGASVSGMFLALKPKDAGTWMFGILVVANVAFSLIDFRLAGAAYIMISTLAGLSLARGRVPWVFLVSAFLIFGFLNQSKFVMRAKYWKPDSTWVDVSLREIPGLYRVWFSESAKMFSGDSSDFETWQAINGKTEYDGQSILERIDNFHILLWVTSAIKENEIPVLNGQTYTLIPKLLIPRLLWKEKPRTHEGQVMLNLHFRRQFTVEQTEKTYIAWGILPEAVGNFGLILGPLFIGYFVGFVFGAIERFSVRQTMFSIEGMLLLGLLLKMAMSHEMVASVFITSYFQFGILIIAGGIFLRRLLGVRYTAAPVRA